MFLQFIAVSAKGCKAALPIENYTWAYRTCAKCDGCGKWLIWLISSLGKQLEVLTPI